MILRKAHILFILLSFALVSCDDMFSEWVGESSGEKMMTAKWNLVDPMNYQDPLYPVQTMNLDPYAAAGYPSLAVQYETLFASWIEGSTIHVRQYNGDDDNPQWTYNIDINLTAPTGAVLCASSYGMLVGFVDNGGLNVQTVSSQMLGTYIHYNTGTPMNLNLVVFNGMVYAVWEEAGLLRMKRYNGNNVWDSSVEDVYGYGINDGYYSPMNSRVTVSDGWLYVAFVEYDSDAYYNRLKVRRYNGYNWETVSWMLNFHTSSPDYIPHLDISSGKDGPFVSWMEYYSPDGANNFNRLNVRSVWGRWIDNYYDSDYDGIPDFNSGIKWDGNTTPMQSLACINVNGNLCAFWVEETFDPIPSQFYNSIRVSLYNGSWNFVDGNNYYGVGLGYSGYPSELRAVTYGDGVAMIFIDSMTGYPNAHVMVGR